VTNRGSARKPAGPKLAKSIICDAGGHPDIPTQLVSRLNPTSGVVASTALGGEDMSCIFQRHFRIYISISYRNDEFVPEFGPRDPSRCVGFVLLFVLDVFVSHRARFLTSIS
jgi:hypothetical protein